MMQCVPPVQGFYLFEQMVQAAERVTDNKGYLRIFQSRMLTGCRLINDPCTVSRSRRHGASASKVGEPDGLTPQSEPCALYSKLHASYLTVPVVTLGSHDNVEY